MNKKRMGLLKNILMGGAIGAYYKGNRASQHWDSEENRARMHTMFPGRHENQGFGYYDAQVRNQQDKAHKEVMRRRNMKEAVATGSMEGMAVGAATSAAAALGTYGVSRRRRTATDVAAEMPPRMAHPAPLHHGFGYGIHGGSAAPAA